MGRLTRGGAMAGALVLAASLALAGCGGDQKKQAEFVGGTGASPSTGAVTPTQSDGASPSAPAAGLAVSPADGAKSRPVSTEISADLPGGGKISSVTLTTGDGKQVGGKMRLDGSSWVPSSALKYNTKYKATVTGTGADGQPRQG